MARWRVYIEPFDTDGTRSGTYVEVTDDVLKLGSLSLRLDHAEFDVGIFRNSNLTMTLRNDHGRFLAPPALESMFPYKRGDCLVKITWDYRDYDLCVGFFTPGNEPMGGEVTMFEGLLDDTAGAEKINDHVVDFTVLGFESLLDRIDVPYADITAGADYISDVIETCLDQTLITDLLTVDSGNISVGQDAVIDAKESLENKTVKDALKSLLFGSNSVLYIKDRVVYVTDRSPSASTLYTFYGQASIAGIENIIDIPVYRDGLNRTFNHWTWKDVPSLVSSDATSIAEYGIRSKEISVDPITDTSKRQSLLDENKNEFRNPLTELEIVAPIDYDTYLLVLLDRVSIDYPTVYFTADGGDLPRYGQAIYGEAVLPVGIFTVTIDSSDTFKIIEKQVMPDKHQFKFTFKEGAIVKSKFLVIPLVLGVCIAVWAGTNNLATKSNGQVINASDVNQYKSALIEALVPRNSSGVPTDVGGTLGTSTYRWDDSYIEKIFIGLSASSLSIEEDTSDLIFKVGGVEKLRLASNGASFDFADGYSPTLKTQAFTGSTTWDVPTGVSNIIVLGCGGGGGGGGGATNGSYGGGAGGKASSPTIGVVAVTPETTLTVTIGGGGSGGATTATGSTGGATTLTYGTVLFRASGGTGGAGTSTDTPGSGGSTGFDSYTTVLIAGGSGGTTSTAGSGGSASVQYPYKSSGGSANLGGGGGGGASGIGLGGNGGTGGVNSTSNGTAGSAGSNYCAGGGGGGGSGGIGFTGGAGGAGSGGYMKVYWVEQ